MSLRRALSEQLPLAAVLASLLLAVLVHPADAAWQIEPAHARGWFVPLSLRHSPAGVPAVAFGVDALRYATFDGAAWSVELVDGACLTQSSGLEAIPSLAFDALGNPAIAWFDRGAGVLMLSRRAAAGWTSEVVDATPVVGAYSSLAFDSAGNPAISYYEFLSRGKLRLARWNGSAWVIEVVDSGNDVGRFSSLAFDSQDRPVIAYRDATSRDLKLGRFDGSAWALEVVDATGDVGEEAALVLDAADHPIVAYRDPGTRTALVSSWDGSTWTRKSLGGSYGGIALALDSAGMPHLTHQTTTFEVEHAQRGATGWTTEAVSAPAGTSGLRTGVSIAAGGEPVVAWTRDYDISDLQAAFRVGATWTTTLVAAGGSGGDGNSIAVPPSGLPGIAHLDRVDGSLLYTRWSGSSWSSELVAANASYSAPSLAYDALGRPAIAYTDGRGVKLARWDGSAWVLIEVDAPSFRRGSVALAFDGSGNPAISYYDTGLKDLKLARFDGSVWTLELVDPEGDDLGRTALAFDSADHPVIAYRDDAATSIKCAQWDGSAWHLSLVGAGREPSLAIDASGKPIIAWVSFTAGQFLKLGRWDGTSWQIEQVDPSIVSAGSALALDAQDRPHLVYNTFSQSLAYARWDGTAWLREVVADVGTAGDVAIALDPTGKPLLSFLDACRTSLWVARDSVVVPQDITIYRGSVPVLAPGWQALSLPLGDLTDDPTGVFPVVTTAPATVLDDLPASAPLQLYRALGPGDAPLLNQLRATKVAGGVEIRY